VASSTSTINMVSQTPTPQTIIFSIQFSSQKAAAGDQNKTRHKKKDCHKSVRVDAQNDQRDSHI
jgi:hypothetical protein